ncbi:hypothetical protein N7507_004574 [Penicillium longicatenatum]|nr:hypothetical protein N7507_004574 [Penicillium longicatenatum]
MAYFQVFDLRGRLYIETLLHSPKEAAAEVIMMAEIVALKSLASWQCRKLLCQTTDYRPDAYISAVNRLESRRILLQFAKACMESPGAGSIFGERLCMVGSDAMEIIDQGVESFQQDIHDLTTDHSVIDSYIDGAIKGWEHSLREVNFLKELINTHGLGVWWSGFRMEAASVTLKHNHDMYMLAEQEESRCVEYYSSGSSFSEDELLLALELMSAEDEKVNKLIADRYDISS